MKVLFQRNHDILPSLACVCAYLLWKRAAKKESKKNSFKKSKFLCSNYRHTQTCSITIQNTMFSLPFSLFLSFIAELFVCRPFIFATSTQTLTVRWCLGRTHAHSNSRRPILSLKIGEPFVQFACSLSLPLSFSANIFNLLSNLALNLCLCVFPSY